jgi:uncharacterized membrane protein (UPF0136 family)
MKKRDFANSEMSFLLAIVGGLILGIMIKKVKIGLIAGVVLGLMLVAGSWLRLFRKKK